MPEQVNGTIWTETGGMKVLCLENTLTGGTGARGGRGGGRGAMGMWHPPFFLKIFANRENPHKWLYLTMTYSLSSVDGSEFFTRVEEASAPKGTLLLWICCTVFSCYSFQFPRIHSVCHSNFAWIIIVKCTWELCKFLRKIWGVNTVDYGQISGQLENREFLSSLAWTQTSKKKNTKQKPARYGSCFRLVQGLITSQYILSYKWNFSRLACILPYTHFFGCQTSLLLLAKSYVLKRQFCTWSRNATFPCTWQPNSQVTWVRIYLHKIQMGKIRSSSFS